MRRALALAGRGRGRVEPNPMVGAVIVKAGRIVGEGFHRRFGGPHAEVEAIAVAGKRAKGATLYVTLEPCCHWGKTPPCTDAVMAAGIGRVVVAMIDPFARVRGRGAAILRKAGIAVSVGLLEEEARELNAAFITRIEKGRPYVIAKWAQSADGCIATASGESKWISSEESRAWVHRLRGRVDGILVGIGTVLKDDPLLTARNGRTGRIATRIVLDAECRLPVDSQLVRTVAEAPVLVVCGERLSKAAEGRRRTLAARGVMTHQVPAGGKGGLDLGRLLSHLAAMEYTHVLVEGGASVLGSLFGADLVDEVHVFVAPLIIGGRGALHAVGGADIRALSEARGLRVADVKRSGVDVHLAFRRRF